jgi:hypothetical protein
MDNLFFSHEGSLVLAASSQSVLDAAPTHCKKENIQKKTSKRKLAVQICNS